MIIITVIIRLEQPEKSALELGKITISNSVYILASTNIKQSAPNWVKIYDHIKLGLNAYTCT